MTLFSAHARLLEFCLANFTMACDNVTITITNDDISEDAECFCAVLSTNDTAMNLSVKMINIAILDDDNATNNIQRIGMVSFLYVMNFQS